jgi:hypothetical protein
VKALPIERGALAYSSFIACAAAPEPKSRNVRGWPFGSGIHLGGDDGYYEITELQAVARTQVAAVRIRRVS